MISMQTIPRLLVANWKSNKNRLEVSDWLDEFEQLLRESNVDLTGAAAPKAVICPPFPFVDQVSQVVQGWSGISLGVQDISPYPAGSYTGAVSVRNLSEFGITHAIVGHSERREYFGETDVVVANKVELLLEAGITPIVCVDVAYIESQATVINSQLRQNCVVAYEPVASIGTGLSQEVAKVLPVVSQITDAWGKVPVLYGGSISPENVAAYYLACNGVLVGGASLKAASFMELLTEAVAEQK